MTTAATPIGLTTNNAPFIEQARAHGEIYIRQPYELYSEANQETWRRLYARMKPRWEMYANPKFREGVNNLALDPASAPVLAEHRRMLKEWYQQNGESLDSKYVVSGN
jgi:phenylalanine-4-hydroxylase